MSEAPAPVTKITAKLARKVPDQRSRLEKFADLPSDEQRERRAGMTAHEKWRLLNDWRFVGRPEQQEPASFRMRKKRRWVIFAGRGWGKTRSCSNCVVKRIMRGEIRQVALIGQTDKSCRELMVEGRSGVVGASPPWSKPIVQPGKHRVLWPNGAMATWYSSKVPSALRGPEHDFAWFDEPAHYQWPRELHDNAMFGLRLGDAQALYSTTPLPIELMRELAVDSSVVMTRGSTVDNERNLSPFHRELLEKYKGTRIGRQEIEGELLLDVPGALWNWEIIDANRIATPDLPEMVRVVVAIDPAVTATETSDETGIVVVARGANGHAYVFDDVSARLMPPAWARVAIATYEDHRGDLIVGEVNNGGDLVEHNLKAMDPTIPFKSVRASRGKVVRAQPVATLYERGMVHHVIGAPLRTLEDQMVLFTPDQTFIESPDRADALVWGLTELMLPEKGSVRVIS